MEIQRSLFYFYKQILITYSQLGSLNEKDWKDNTTKRT